MGAMWRPWDGAPSCSTAAGPLQGVATAMVANTRQSSWRHERRSTASLAIGSAQAGATSAVR